MGNKRARVHGAAVLKTTSPGATLPLTNDSVDAPSTIGETGDMTPGATAKVTVTLALTPGHDVCAQHYRWP